MHPEKSWSPKKYWDLSKIRENFEATSVNDMGSSCAAKALGPWQEETTVVCSADWIVWIKGEIGRTRSHFAGAVSVPQRPFLARLQTAHRPLVGCKHTALLSLCRFHTMSTVSIYVFRL